MRLIGLDLDKFFLHNFNYISVAIYIILEQLKVKTHFFSPGALMTYLLILLTTYFFGIYIEIFQNKQLYGSIGALLIFILYTFKFSVLLLGFELNATLHRLKNQDKVVS